MILRLRPSLLCFTLSVSVLACGDDGVAGGGSSTGDETSTTVGPTSSSTASSPSTSSDPTGDPTTDATTDPATDTTTGSDTTAGDPSTGDTSSSTEPPTSTDTGDTESSSTESSSSTSTTTAECTVPESHATIAAALLDVACPTVFVLPGTYAENLFVARDVTIEGTGDGEAIVDGSAAGSTVTISAGVSVTLRALTVTGGVAAQGGGIRNAGTLLLDDVLVTGNEATGVMAQGGGIFSIGDVELRGTTLEQNTVTASGDGALGRGGGIWLQGAALDVSDGSRVATNAVTVSDADGGAGAGGGIFARMATVTLGAGTVVEGNTVDTSGDMAAAFGHVASGGAVATVDSTVVFDDGVELRANGVTASGPGVLRIAEGGALFVSGGTVTTGALVLDDNAARAIEGSANASGGGAVFSNALSVEIASLRARGNLAQASASAAGEEAIARGGSLHVLGTDGLAVTFELGDAVIDDSTAQADVAGMATARGGGLLVEAQSGASASARIERVAIVNAHALGDAVGEGGGVAVLGGDSAAVELAILNATLSGGTVAGTTIARGGNLGVGAPLAGADVEVAVRFATVVAGAADPGGSLVAVWADPAGTAQVTITGSILDDLGAGAASECTMEGGTVTSAGLNLLSGTCAAFGVATDVLDVDPMLGALTADGDHLIHLPATTSPAFDLVAAPECVDELGAALTVDQRGLPRPADLGCEAGAVEVQP